MMASFKRAEGGPVAAAEHVVDVFMGEAGNESSRSIGDVCLAAVLVIVNGVLENFFGDGQGFMLIKFDVGGAFDLHFGGGGDDLGVEVLSQPNQCLHDALHIHDHGFNSPGEDGEFLLEEVASSRNALAHEDFVGRAADAGKVDAFCTSGLGIFDDLRV